MLHTYRVKHQKAHCSELRCRRKHKILPKIEYLHVLLGQYCFGNHSVRKEIIGMRKLTQRQQLFSTWAVLRGCTTVSKNDPHNVTLHIVQCTIQASACSLNSVQAVLTVHRNMIFLCHGLYHGYKVTKKITKKVWSFTKPGEG